jgi:hypothetical protein
MDIKYGMKNAHSDVFHKARAILHEFILVSVLCGVTNAALNMEDGSHSHKTVHLNAHECAMAIPKYIFFGALRRRAEQRLAEDKFSTKSAASRIIKHAIKSGDVRRGKDYTIHILEGTGVLDPLPSEESPSEMRLKSGIEQYSARLAMQKSQSSGSSSSSPQDISDPIGDSFSEYHYQPKSKHNFYKMMLTLMTEELFLVGIDVYELIVCYDNSNQSSTARVFPQTPKLDLAQQQRSSIDTILDVLNKKQNTTTLGPDLQVLEVNGKHYTQVKTCYSRGVLFTHLLDIEKHQNVHIVPCPPLSAKVIAAASSILRNEYPTLALRVPSRKLVSEFLQGQIAKVMTLFEKSKQDWPVNTTRSTIVPGTSKMFFIHFTSVKNPKEFVSHLLNTARCAKVLLNITAEPIKVSIIDKGIVGGYSVTFFCPNTHSII